MLKASGAMAQKSLMAQAEDILLGTAQMLAPRPGAAFEVKGRHHVTVAVAIRDSPVAICCTFLSFDRCKKCRCKSARWISLIRFRLSCK
jgi:hypothetical protein